MKVRGRLISNSKILSTILPKEEILFLRKSLFVGVLLCSEYVIVEISSAFLRNLTSAPRLQLPKGGFIKVVSKELCIASMSPVT